MTFVSHRKHLMTEFRVEAGPGAVFPLLCPVREYDWIPFWKCKLLYSVSGLAEKDCVFRTFFLHRGRELWTCYLHEPDERIGYLRLGGGRVSRLEVTLRPERNHTSVSWVTTLTGITRRGNRFIEKMDQEEYEREIKALGAMLDRYVTTGASMPKGEARHLFKHG
ncbi:MAG: hypothetical protein KKB70_10685 [Proteobacteria bacterium]|nr:hypothetical protein [Pseudomonadota bacterium]MBU1611153.1 hypothetical protein [Pseudomonadota bacterium]